jgi:hypothetical protein
VRSEYSAPAASCTGSFARAPSPVVTPYTAAPDSAARRTISLVVDIRSSASPATRTGASRRAIAQTAPASRPSQVITIASAHRGIGSDTDATILTA